MYDYCNEWKLSINTDKTKIMVMSRGKIRNKPIFNFGPHALEVVDSYKYLGLVFNYDSKFSKAKSELYDRGCRAMFALLRKARCFNLPIDGQFELFDALVLTVVLYGCEVWSPEGCDILEKLHLRFCKFILSVNKSTSTCMIYGELGRRPIDIIAKTRALSFWARLITTAETKISSMMYHLLYNMHVSGFYHNSWILFIEKTLNDCGFSGIWNEQRVCNSVEAFKIMVINRLHDQFIQQWGNNVFNNNKCINYRIFRDNFGLEDYLVSLPMLYKRVFTKFRCRNNKFPVEIGCRQNVSREMRFCKLCDVREVGDEYHYLLICKYFQRSRSTYIKSFYITRSSILKMAALMNCQGTDLIKLCKFVKIILSAF